MKLFKLTAICLACVMLAFACVSCNGSGNGADTTAAKNTIKVTLRIKNGFSVEEKKALDTPEPIIIGEDFELEVEEGKKPVINDLIKALAAARGAVVTFTQTEGFDSIKYDGTTYITNSFPSGVFGTHKIDGETVNVERRYIVMWVWTVNGVEHKNDSAAEYEIKTGDVVEFILTPELSETVTDIVTEAQ